jgi:hypothetical protein
MHTPIHRTAPRLRQRKMLPVAIALLVWALAACETPAPPKPPVAEPPRAAAPSLPPPISADELARQATLRDLLASQDRLYRVAAPLLLDNAPLCKRHSRNLLGFTAKNKYSYSSEYVDSVQGVLGLGDQLQIVGVMAGSGAANAGVRRGDKLIAVEDTPLPQGPNAEHQAGQALVSLLAKKTVIDLRLNRQGNELSLQVPLTNACAFVVELGNTDSVNAYADGHRVMVTRGMLNFVTSDEELATILATEMAHNVLGDVAKRHMGAAVGAVIDNLTRIHPELNNMADAVKPAPPEANNAADRLGLYLAARAGYDIVGAEQFWSRLANQYPSGAADAYTTNHPLSAYRLSAIAKIVAEIKAKQAAGQVLMPSIPTLPPTTQAAPKPAAPVSPIPLPTSRTYLPSTK